MLPGLRSRIARPDFSWYSCFDEKIDLSIDSEGEVRSKQLLVNHRCSVTEFSKDFPSVSDAWKRSDYLFASWCRIRWIIFCFDDCKFYHLKLSLGISCPFLS